MKNKKFKKLAVAGLLGSFIVVNPVHGDDAKKGTSSQAQDQNVGYHLYTEEELLLELDPEGVKNYQSLDAEGKRLARLVASQRCDHTNECKGLNACKTDKNTCAGKSNCKNQGKCALADKNLAVKLVVDKMASKRADATK